MFYISELRKIIWPIEWHENKKFLPMAMMMFCILLNYATLRSVKDGFVVTTIGPEAISFLKTYIVLPSAILAAILYTKLCNIMVRQYVFYTVTSCFLVYFAVFAFILYPNPDQFRLDAETVQSISNQYPNFQWFVKIAGQWVFASFYTISELWGAMMLSLLFWQFANQIIKTDEAKRFYSMFGLLGNCALPATSLLLGYFLNENIHIVPERFRFTPILVIIIISGLVVMALYYWVNAKVLTDTTLYTPSKAAKKEKMKLSFAESFKLIFSSKYLGLIAVLILSYGISINLVEGIWKSKIKLLYPTKEAYTMFMGQFQAWQGYAAILFMIIGSNILRRVSWSVAAAITPLMILVTGIAFFAFIFFDNTIAMHITGLFTSGPLVIAVIIGMIQNVLSKATKYSLFDATKEMAYIPLADELKAKGKAAVDVIGGRLGKSGGGIIQSTCFMLFPTLTFQEATPYFAIVFFVIVILWLYGIKALSNEYTKLVNTN